jgi:hypothetical protein
MIGNENDQREFFPPGKDDLPGNPRRSITPGDWLFIEHQGKTVIGMIYRHQGKAYTFVYWDNLILRFDTATRDQIGPWNEELTAQFRGQIAVVPDYVEKCIAVWVMQPEQPVKRFNWTVWESTETRSLKVQKRLFPP